MPRVHLRSLIPVLSRRLTAVLVLLVVLAGCDGSSQDGTTSTTSRPAVTRPSPESAVLTDYATFWEAYIGASRTANPEDPRLAQHATGGALKRLRLQLALYRAQKLVASGQLVRTGTRVIRMRGSTAQVADCLDSNKWLARNRETGKVSGRPDGKTNRVRATLTRTGGLWKVSVLDIQESECDDA